MAKKKYARLPAGEGYHLAPGVPPYRWEGAPQHGVVYEHKTGARAAGKWRPAKEGEPTGRMHGGQWVDVRHARVPRSHYSGREDQASDSSDDEAGAEDAKYVDLSHGLSAAFDDFEEDDLDALAHPDTSHTMAWPAAVGDVFAQLRGVMSRVRKYDASSASAWVASAAVAEIVADEGRGAVVRVCDHADMQKHALFDEVVARLQRMVAPLGSVGSREALSVVHDWTKKAAEKDMRADYFDTFGIECDTGSFFVALAFAADPRHDPSADTLELDHVMCGGLAVFVRGKSPCHVTTYLLRPNPVVMHRDDAAVHTRVVTAEATVMRSAHVTRGHSHPSAVGHRVEAHAGQKYTLELVMVAFEDGETPHFTARLLLRDPDDE